MKLAQALLERHDADLARNRLLPSFLKMAAIATIADAVPLRGENRVIAALGLRELRRPVGAGLRALFAAAQLDPATKPITAFDIAFRLAPRINAAGRMDVASEIIELFCTRDAARASELANKLERLNRERRETEARALAAIEARLAADAELGAARLVIMDGDGWHRGVIGILASRVVERTAKPALVISVEDGVAHGSGRSVDGFQLLEAIETCADLFTRFGGHAFAVGFALPAASLPELKRRLAVCAAERLAAREPERILNIHAELPLHQITAVLAGWLRKLGPLGHGNPEPIFVARNARVTSTPRIMKERHLRLELAQDEGATAAIRAVGWDMAAVPLNSALRRDRALTSPIAFAKILHPDFGGLEIEIAGLRHPADEFCSVTMPEHEDPRKSVGLLDSKLRFQLISAYGPWVLCLRAVAVAGTAHAAAAALLLHVAEWTRLSAWLLIVPARLCLLILPRLLPVFILRLMRWLILILRPAALHVAVAVIERGLLHPHVPLRITVVC